MDDITALVEEDAGLAPSVDNLKTLSSLVEQQLDIEAEIAELEAQLRAKNQTLNKISGEEIPALMSACGMESFTLKSDDATRTGASVSVKPDVSMSLGDAVKPRVINWLKQNNHGDIVSNEITVAVPKGFDATKVEQVRRSVLSAGLGYVEAENVNTSTVKSLYKDLRENGKLTEDAKFFGAHHYNKTTIKLPAEKKPRASRK